jgi:GNAT superfamily N-acetyltransferase
MQPRITVADCERAQASWFLTCARLLGGDHWSEGGLTWARSGDHADLLFPSEIDAAALEAGLTRAGRPGVTVGAWLSLEVDPTPLVAAGFERGWSPWWMTAGTAVVGGTSDPRVVLRETSADYVGEHADYGEMLALTRERPKHTWYAAAYAPPDGRFAGQAWSHLAGDGVAGIFDMAVWAPFRRQGLGTALLEAVSDAARRAGASHAVLNATPEGKKLYETRGFRQIGEGITWWLHSTS